MEKIKYKIEFVPDIYDKFLEFPKSVREMITKAMNKKLTSDPVFFGKPLRYTLAGLRSLRISDYRVIYQIIEDKVIVLIVDIDHRKDVYE